MGEIILALVGFSITVLGTVAVFRKGAGDSIDRKRESEIERLDRRLDEVVGELEIVAKDSRIVAIVAVRAIREIEKSKNTQFTLSDEEREALERTRPLLN